MEEAVAPLVIAEMMVVAFAHPAIAIWMKRIFPPNASMRNIKSTSMP